MLLSIAANRYHIFIVGSDLGITVAPILLADPGVRAARKGQSGNVKKCFNLLNSALMEVKVP